MRYYLKYSLRHGSDRIIGFGPAHNIKASLSAIAALLSIAIMTSVAYASPSVHTNYGSTLNASSCNSQNNPLVRVSLKVTNDADSGFAGNAWANDNYTKNIEVWQQSSNSFCAIVKYDGQFVTYAGPSPNNGGTVGAGVKGTFEGGYQATFNGSLSTVLKTKGYIGSYDFKCDTSFNCPGYFDWLTAYFPSYSNFAEPYWAWNYHAGNNGSWVNASTGSSGDITGN
ncbi:MAG TPA: hypothetical protein VNE40_02605 [Candidatus Dormibacteraeota bacterium]|nr:hypothetical protein [Candidatus Dormibacteraeota bacterium]